MKKGIILGYKEIFSDEKAPLIKDLLKSISRKTLIHSIAFLNASIHANRSLENQAKLFGLFTIHFNKDIKDSVYKKVNEMESEFESVTFVTYRTLLELTLEVIKLDEDENYELNMSIEEELLFFKSILLANESLNHKQRIHRVNQQETYSDENYFRFLFPNFLSQYEFQRYNMPFTGFTKGLYFFNFAENDELFKKLLPYFCKKNKVKDWREYIEVLFKCYISIITPKDDKIGVILNLTDDVKTLASFLDRFCINKSLTDISDFQEEQVLDYKLIREAPLYKLKESQYVFLNFNFFIDKLYQGLFFEFKEVLENLPKEEYSEIVGSLFNAPQSNFFNAFKSYFSSNFTEKVIFYETIKNIFIDKKAIHIEDDKKNGLVDYYIRYHNKIFLFEFKDVSINAKEKHSFDYEIIKKALLSKFSQGKGTTQLANAIEKLSNGDLKFEKLGDRLYPTSKMEIYPIIIFTDYVFSFNGIDRLLDEEFKNQLNKSNKINGTKYKKIHDLALIHFDFLLLMESLFNSKRINFIEILNEYLMKVKKLKARNKFRTPHEYISKFDSFNEIIESSLKRKNILPTVPPLLFQKELKNLLSEK
jgi:hypothetical protein